MKKLAIVLRSMGHQDCLALYFCPWCSEGHTAADFEWTECVWKLAMYRARIREHRQLQHSSTSGLQYPACLMLARCAGWSRDSGVGQNVADMLRESPPLRRTALLTFAVQFHCSALVLLAG